MVVWGRRNYGRRATEKNNSRTGISKLLSFVLVLFCYLLKLRDFRTISIFVCFLIVCYILIMKLCVWLCVIFFFTVLTSQACRTLRNIATE